MQIAGLALAVLLLALAFTGKRQPSGVLPALGVRINETSVSGISSGAYMAGQFQIAHSGIVMGAAIIAGGPYGCAESLFADLMPGPGTAFLNLSKAMNGCMLDNLQPWGIPNPRKLAERAERLAADGRIDPIAGVRADRIYLFAGKSDRVVQPSIVAAAAELYRLLGVQDDQIKHVTAVDAGHAFVTEQKGEACGRSTPPFVVRCGYDQAGELLRHIYGPLKPRSDRPAGVLLGFDQREFTRELMEHGLSDRGVVYVPDDCRRSPGCRVHVAFHGCGQNRGTVGDAFVSDTGFAPWADTNRIVVLFPDAASGPTNPQACWDWWGHTGREFLTRKSPQMTAIRRMLERLAAAR